MNQLFDTHRVRRAFGRRIVIPGAGVTDDTQGNLAGALIQSNPTPSAVSQGADGRSDARRGCSAVASGQEHPILKYARAC